MNTYIEMQIKNLLMFLDGFEKSCIMAATKDDGKIDRTEQKQLSKIRTATAKYKKELEKIL